MPPGEFSVPRSPESSQEWNDYYLLRWDILRAPWHQPPGSEKDELESEAIHRFITGADSRVLAVGRLHLLDDHSAQVRYMATHPQYQRLGLGGLILASLEQAALQQGIVHIMLHARSQATDFYTRHGYSLLNRSHTLFGKIEHYQMVKQLR